MRAGFDEDTEETELKAQPSGTDTDTQMLRVDTKPRPSRHKRQPPDTNTRASDGDIYPNTQMSDTDMAIG